MTLESLHLVTETAVTVTGVSQTLSAILAAVGAAIHANIEAILIIPRSGTSVFRNLNGTAATASSALLPASGMMESFTAAQLATMELVASGTVGAINCDIRQYRYQLASADPGPLVTS